MKQDCHGIRLLWGLAIAFVFLVWTGALRSQTTSTTGAIVGVVSDPSGAVIPGAKLVLKSVATGAVTRTETNKSGQYSFPVIGPGTYSISVTADGFRTGIVSDVTVQVAKSTLVNVVLRVGSLAQSVTVQATIETQLQTSNATVGNVVGTQEIENLPTVTRRAYELVYLQPGAQPWTGGAYNGSSGTIAGAAGDQNTFTLDGLDISDAQVGGECCGSTSAGMPLPVEAIQEFRSSITNQNANFGRSAGGDFSFTVRRGTPNYHGALYWYHVDNHLVANTWEADRLGQPKAKFLDNRYGFRVGGPLLGPVMRHKLYFFLNLERRRFPNSSQVSGLVPTDTLRSGILRFRDASGNIISYNLANSNLCGLAGSSLCDPRGVGISPVIKQQYSLLPSGNDSSLGDQLNTTGISGPADSSVNQDNVVGRIDYAISSKWHANGTWAWAQNAFYEPFNVPGVDWRGGANHIVTTSVDANHPRLYAFGLTGQLSPTTINEFDMGFNQSTIQFEMPHPSTLIPDAGVALHLPVVQDPIQINGARAQLGVSRTWQFTDNITKMIGNHQLQFGADYEHLYFLQNRQGANIYNIYPMADIGTNQFVPVPNSERPPTCGTGITTNCLLPNDVSLWNDLYAATLGIVDSVDDVVVRNPNGTAQSIGSPIASAGTWHHLEWHAGDIWRVTDSLTLNLGVLGTFETPFSDNRGRQDFIVSLQTGEPIDPVQYLKKRAQMARVGQVYNPGFAWSPIGNFGGRGYFPNQYHMAPRLAAAWNPSFKSGVLGRLFGFRKSVFRAGFGLGYYRILAVGEVQFPQEGDQLLAQTNSLVAPLNSQGQPFRVGVDGPAPLPPVVPQIASPYTPPFNYGAGTILAFDPNYHNGSMSSADVTYQREIPGNILFEVGYMGRFSRSLETAVDLNAVPFFIADLSHKSAQTFAQAFDSVATQLRAGVSPANVTPQPWFENSIGPGATVQLASTASADFIGEFTQTLWRLHIDPMLSTPVENQQIVNSLDLTPLGWSNYNAMFISVNKRPSKGLMFTLNYTLSKWGTTGEDTTDGGAWQPENDFNLHYGYGPAAGDRRNVISFYDIYDLPFGRGHRLTGGPLHRLVDGWHWSNIIQFASGVPEQVYMSGQSFGSLNGWESIPEAAPLNFSQGLHKGISGSNGIGVAGDPATGGTGLNLFSNPAAAYNDFRPFLISQDTGNSGGVIRGLSRFTWDTSLHKDIAVAESFKFNLGFDFFNVLNHPLFNDPFLNYLDPASFGVISSQPGDPTQGDFWTPRRVQVSLRLEF